MHIFFLIFLLAILEKNTFLVTITIPYNKYNFKTRLIYLRFAYKNYLKILSILKTYFNVETIGTVFYYQCWAEYTDKIIYRFKITFVGKTAIIITDTL